MEPSSKEMQGMASMIALQDLQNGGQSHSIQHPFPYDQPPHSHDDFFDQMLSSYPSWSDSQKQLFNSIVPLVSGDDDQQGTFDDSALLASRLRQHQISGDSPAAAPQTKPAVLTQQQLIAQAAARSAGIGDSGLLPLPLTLGSTDSSAHSRLDVDGPFGSHNPGGDATVQGLYNGYGGSLPRTSLTANNQQPQLQYPQAGSTVPQAFIASGGGINQAGAAAGNGGAPRQRVRARRGQATDPHSIAERLRRERIAERMKALQELVPDANKTDKASMLDEIIDYVKFLQLQVKVLSMSRLGGAAAVAPLVADNSSEAANGHGRSGGNGAQSASASDSLTVTEHQVAKLMEEDMGSAMQYLQGKGLCLMPISLASAISSATRTSNPLLGKANGGADAPPSPSMSVLTVQSAIANGGGADTSVKDAASVSKP